MRLMMAAKLHGIRKLSLVHSLKVWDDPQHAVAYTANVLAMNKPFADFWRDRAAKMKVPGVQFVPVIMDLHVELLQNGAIVRHKNEVDEIETS